MHYVYIIQSINFPEILYTGYSTNLESRLSTHNSGGSEFTSDYKPWRCVWYCNFLDKYSALEFEKYLKSHSGRAFMKKRLIACSK